MAEIKSENQTVSMQGHVNGQPFFTPTEKVVASFIPRESFGPYLKGEKYWLREGNLKLAKNLLEWPVDIIVLDPLYEGMTHGDCTRNRSP